MRTLRGWPEFRTLYYAFIIHAVICWLCLDHWREFTIVMSRNPQNDRVCAPAVARKKHVASERVLWTHSTFSKSQSLTDHGVRERVPVWKQRSWYSSILGWRSMAHTTRRTVHDGDELKRRMLSSAWLGATRDQWRNKRGAQLSPYFWWIKIIKGYLCICVDSRKNAR